VHFPTATLRNRRHAREEEKDAEDSKIFTGWKKKNKGQSGKENKCRDERKESIVREDKRNR
jgi:hypothetical protein